jgi:hypothetical protein
VDNEWLGLGDTTLIPTRNIFADPTPEEVENPALHLLGIMRRSENFAFACKHLLNRVISPMQACVLWELWHRPFPMLLGSRGMSKSWTLAAYSMLRALFCQGSKIVIVGAAFRQSKVVFDYCESMWQSSPILRDMVGTGNGNGPRHEADRCSLRLGESIITALPLGDGSRIRGQRASILLCEEFASVPLDIFENVVSGFAAVSLSPIEKMQAAGRLRAMKKLGMVEADTELPVVPGMNSNQTVLSGTAYYRFNHFFQYWSRYKAIIESQGDPKKLSDIFGGEVPERFNWRDYSIVRIPHNLIPDGFMDEKTISRAKVTYHKTQFLMEMSACWPVDSDGFFKRSLIETCVVGRPLDPITLPSAGAGPIDFSATLRGFSDRRYVFGVDPASESDNFSIVVLEVWPDHRRVVYCWTTTRKRHKARKAKGTAHEDDFYHYAMRKIRELMQLFPCAHIALDKMGGGVPILEALADPSRLLEGELPVLPVIDPENPQDTDRVPGLHILELVYFARADWVSGANHGLRFDLESKTLLFPSFDSASVGLALEEDRAAGRVQDGPDGEAEVLYDTLEDCVLEIEELKEELASIVHTQVGTTGRDHWDTPESRSILGKKTRTRKDRYSALLMANMAARTLAATPARPSYYGTGGFATDLARGHASAVVERPRGWLNPAWYEQGGRGAVARRK